MVRYRIGITPIAFLPQRDEKEEDRVPKATMCREDAPVEWHTEVFKTFSAVSWSEACQVFDRWCFLHSEGPYKKKELEGC